MNIYDQDLDTNAANFTPLSPISMMRRVASIYPDKAAVVYGERRLTWGDIYTRCVNVATALTRRGIARGETVAVLSANLPEMFEVHFAVPMTGAVLNAINMRLDAASVAFILEHGEAKLLLVDKEFGPLAEQALGLMSSPPPVIHIDDASYSGGKLIGDEGYEDLVREGEDSPLVEISVDAVEFLPGNEWDAIALNYTCLLYTSDAADE